MTILCYNHMGRGGWGGFAQSNIQHGSSHHNLYLFNSILIFVQNNSYICSTQYSPNEDILCCWWVVGCRQQCLQRPNHSGGVGRLGLNTIVKTQHICSNCFWYLFKTGEHSEKSMGLFGIFSQHGERVPNPKAQNTL